MTSQAPTADILGKVLRQAGSDQAYRRRLIEVPKTVLAEAGMPIPSDVEIRPVESTPDLTYLVLPTPPAEGAVSDEDLSAATGGATAAFFITLVAGFMISLAITDDS